MVKPTRCGMLLSLLLFWLVHYFVVLKVFRNKSGKYLYRGTVERDGLLNALNTDATVSNNIVHNSKLNLCY